jgi:hypothetical protein
MVWAVSASLSAAPPSDNASWKSASRKDSPQHTFQVEERVLEQGNSEWKWQIWIVPKVRHAEAYLLPHPRSYPANYSSEVSIAPDERAMFVTQKTGSGDNSGALYLRAESGRYELTDSDTSFDAKAWREFDSRLHFATDSWKSRYHEGIEFIGWDPDHETFEVALRGRHTGEDYSVNDWLIHYHLRTKKFFTAADEQAHNQKSFQWKNWRRP